MTDEQLGKVRQKSRVRGCNLYGRDKSSYEVKLARRKSFPIQVNMCEYNLLWNKVTLSK